MTDNGCEGGEANSAYEYIHKYGITDETCSSYRARGHTNGETCKDEIKCVDCKGEKCIVPEKYMVYRVKEYG